MSEKKRKSTSNDEERPTKKQQTRETVQVSHFAGSDVAKPVVASSPGVTLPSNVKFQSFAKQSQHGPTNLLLRSSDHPTIDYTATEGTTSGEQYLKHYVAVFDPVSGKLQVTEAKRLMVRSSVRQVEPAGESDEEQDENVPVTNYSSRSALTQAFGTKKSKKAVQSMAENRLLAQGGEGASVTHAMLSQLPDGEDIGGASTQEEPRSNKPLPIANCSTNDINEVYPLSSLVVPSPGNNTLKIMPTGPWLARMNAKKDVKNLRSRFVASRLGYIGKALLASPEASDPMLTQYLQLLRYIQLLLEINTYFSRLPRKRTVPPPDKWPEKTVSEGTPSTILQPIIYHFLPDRLPTTHALTLLRTTILALTLHIPPPSLNHGVGMLVTEPTDISLDLAMEAIEVRKLYRELGCKIEAAKDSELERWGLDKVKKVKKDVNLPKPMFAKLSLPIEFPKVSRGRPSQRR